MRTVMIVGGGFLTLVVLIASFLISNYVSSYNYANEIETAINTEYKNNQNILGQFSAKITEMAQVPDIMKNDIVEIIKANMSGRYGADGSKAQWQWIKENNLTVSPELYNRLQQTMEAGRNEFKNGQTALLSKCQGYETQRGYLLRGMFIRMAGYPKLDVVKMCTPVQSSHSQQAFDSGIDNGIKIN